jgi:peptide-methionine (R)-S-oxide reductase
MKRMPETYWREKLTSEQYRVLRQAGTERPFTGELLNTHDDGVFRCAACKSPLFSSGAKFDSGSGWPSFYDVVEQGNVELEDDRSQGMTRIEIRCATCGGHLGHLFDDGPRPTGKRYCVNSAALEFDRDAAP